MSRIIVVTGTDTGVGKTVFTALLTHFLRQQGTTVAALKPLSSGARDDARTLRQASDGTLKLDEINPWHFRAALSPLLAARKERRRVTLREVVSHVHGIAVRFPMVLVEGAGGLLSPLGEGFSTRELIGGLSAEVVVVARNQLGVVNHARLTLEALPPLIRARAKIVLVSLWKSNAASQTNAALLSEFAGAGHVFSIPSVNVDRLERSAALPAVRRTLAAVVAY